MSDRDRLARVYWLGGMSGVGKTTAARALAHRHDLRLYSFDAHQFEHASRLPAETRTLDEVWVDTTPVALADWFEERCRERFPLVLVGQGPRQVLTRSLAVAGKADALRELP